MEILRTERQLIRHITLEDADFILALLNTPGWLAYIGDRGVRTVAAAEQYIQERILPSYQAHGFGFYACELLQDTTVVGICGFAQRPYLAEPDLGYGFLPAYMGQGLATEAALALLNYGHSSLGFTILSAIITPDNQRSIRLITQLGFIAAGNIRVPPEMEEINLYRWGG
ncbi:MAG: GNAT family N-acetyltransferase [Saprospiraceae bacterium]